MCEQMGLLEKFNMKDQENQFSDFPVEVSACQGGEH
jgi:hypothetical protein